jgi:anti-sigma regulatory factor (Ser/Thr protein kinase)
VIPFLRGGVAAGSPTLLGVDPRQQALILAALGDTTGVTVLDVDQYARPYTAIRVNHELMRRHASSGAAQVRMIGTVPSAGRTWHGWSRYEAAVNHVAADLPVWGLCLYDRRETPDEVLEDVERTHPRLLSVDGEHRVSPRYIDSGAFIAGRAATDVDPLEDTTPHLELTAPTPSFARRGVLALAATTPLDEGTIERLGLAVGEVVANAIQHGEPPIVLRAWLADDRVVVAVSDGGAGPRDPHAGLLPGTTDRPDALGLHLAYQSCSELTVDFAGDRFTVHLTARDERAALSSCRTP